MYISNCTYVWCRCVCIFIYIDIKRPTLFIMWIKLNIHTHWKPLPFLITLWWPCSTGIGMYFHWVATYKLSSGCVEKRAYQTKLTANYGGAWHLDFHVQLSPRSFPKHGMKSHPSKGRYLALAHCWAALANPNFLAIESLWGHQWLFSEMMGKTTLWHTFWDSQLYWNDGL